MIVYLDLVVILNFLVDGLLLLGTNRLSGHPPGWGRVLPAAALGGLYAGVCMVPGFGFLGNVFWRLVSLSAMAAIAFGWNVGALTRGAVFLLLSMAMGGLALGMGTGNFGSVLLAAVALAALCAVGIPHPVGSRSYQPVQLQWQGKRLDFTALIDTGNTLRDPITGSAVLVAGADIGEMLGFSREILEDPVKALGSGMVTGARLIPYRTVGRPAGMLVLIQAEEVRLGGKVVSPLVALAPEIIGGNYQALAGGKL